MQKEFLVSRSQKSDSFLIVVPTMHLQSGVDVRRVQKWLGHSDLTTTQKYCDWLDAHSEEAGRQVNKTFAACAVPTLELTDRV